MGDRRTQLLDAGLELVATEGLGGLTHEALGARAQVPAGSTEECFPTREALIQGVTERCIERELEMATGPRPEIEASPEGIAAAFGHFVLRALGEDRAVTLARYALHAEAARTPALRELYAVGADTVDTWALDLVRRAGARHPERDFGIMANYVTGLVFHELALPTPEFDPADRLRVLIDALGWNAP
jgi:DNA-binding transcriptional regulator YbjK